VAQEAMAATDDLPRGVRLEAAHPVDPPLEVLVIAFNRTIRLPYSLWLSTAVPHGRGVRSGS
jgi:hypothetical protein